jgi:hypothetical protein
VVDFGCEFLFSIVFLFYVVSFEMDPGMRHYIEGEADMRLVTTVRRPNQEPSSAETAHNVSAPAR